jgi:hypothetical protein
MHRFCHWLSVLVLISLYVTQGIGWLFGLFIVIPNSTSSVILGWLFTVFIGLEDLWMTILSAIIRITRIDESLRLKATKMFRTSNDAIRRRHEVSIIAYAADMKVI